MNIKYYEHYPHMMGTVNTRVKMNEDLFAWILTLVSSEDSFDHDLLEELEMDVDSNGRGPYAIYDLFTTKNMVKKLQKNGFITDTWEEGSFYIALPGFTKPAMRALVKIESGIAMDAAEF